jgi:D-xylose transport system permease protein
VAFTLAAFTAGLGGLVYASRLGSISVGYDGSTCVLYAVAAAVIGGASLFGGYGKACTPCSVASSSRRWSTAWR